MDSHGALPDNLRVVVIDTNAMPEGRLDLNQLRSLPRLLSKFPDVGIWIPEPVMWEWASHAQQDYDDALAAANLAARRLGRAGVKTQLPYVKEADRHDVGGGVIAEVSSLPAPFRVIWLADYPDVAIEALRRQVLLESPARRKSGVKTGAADTAVLLLAERAPEDVGGEWIIISHDADVRQHAPASGAPWPRVFRGVRDLRNAALAFQPIALRLVPHVFSLVRDRLDQIRAGVASLGKVGGDGVVREVFGNDKDLLSVDLEVSWLDRIAVLRNVEVDTDTRIGTAGVVVVADVEVTGWRMDPYGDQLVSDNGTAYGSSLLLYVTFSLDGDDVDIEPATATPQVDSYSSAGDALNVVLTAAAQVPGFHDLLDEQDRPRIDASNPQWSSEVNGRKVELAMTGSGEKDDDRVWRLAANVGNYRSEVSCYAEDTWVGDGAYEMRHHLTAEDSQPTFALSRFLLAHIYDAVDGVPDQYDRHGQPDWVAD